LFTFAALVPGFHEVVVRFEGDSFPFAEQNVDRAEAVVIGALAKERQWLSLVRAIVKRLQQALVRLAETLLVVFSPRIPRLHLQMGCGAVGRRLLWPRL
jgi:hypothetical protein